MSKFNSNQFMDSIQSSFFSKHKYANKEIMPSLLVNDYKRELRILSDIQKELATCKSFDFAVAFITMEGVASILQILKELEDNGVQGRILTTNYLNFTAPAALSKILELKNIELKTYTQGGYHPKGYIFNQGEYYSIIVGSANLTATALSQNQEWSMKFVSYNDGQIVEDVKNEFETIWQDAEVVTPEWIEKYTEEWKKNKFSVKKNKKEIEIKSAEEIDDDSEFVPNSMQEEAMLSLSELRDLGKNKALLIAATGTGKTYLSILDVLQTRSQKVLYVAHRDMILKKSEESFKNLMPNIKTGFLNGENKDFEADFLFASVFTLAKDEFLNKIDEKYFDYIIIDEVHHAGAKSYEKIINYFKPKFMLGLTATPERSDGVDIYEMFGNNVAYEIRLQTALEKDLLCPFHYYGLTDITVNGEAIDDKSDFTKLTSCERIRHIENALKLYKDNSAPVKGLIFCSRIDEGKALSIQLNKDGFNSICLFGADDEQTRATVIDRLESDEDPLNYIITVDIFNEGVDIPSINQVVMLRPTESAIIFIQQLGRGLRKALNKTYVSVIDFIGNYENNFFIPIALFGDYSYNKDNIRRALSSGSAALPGTSTIQMSEIAKQRIYNSINNTTFAQKRFLEGEFLKLKMRMGKIPSMMDFVNHGYIDPFLFIDYAGSYYEFKIKIKEIDPHLSDEARKSLQFISLEFAHGIRFHELLILNILQNQKTILKSDFEIELLNYGVKLKKKDLMGMLNTLSSEFYRNKGKYGTISYISYDEATEIISRTTHFDNLLSEEEYKKELNDCLSYGLKRATLKNDEKYIDDNFVLYRKYTRKDVCKLLNWDKDYTSTIYGYKTETKYEEYTCPIFVTYHKKEDISDTTKYNDVFIDNTKFSWMSRTRRTSQSSEVAEILNQKNNNIKILLFVKKNDDEGSDFYYLGNLSVDSFSDQKMKDGDKEVPVVNILFDMNNSVPSNIYNFITA